MEEIREEILEEVSGGKGTIGKVLITNCNHYVNVRDAASTEGAKIGRAYLNDEYEYYGFSGHWCKIKYHGKRAYVHEKFIAIIK